MVKSCAAAVQAAEKPSATAQPGVAVFVRADDLWFAVSEGKKRKQLTSDLLVDLARKHLTLRSEMCPVLAGLIKDAPIKLCVDALDEISKW